MRVLRSALYSCHVFSIPKWAERNPSGCEQTRCRQIFTGYCCELCQWAVMTLFQEIKWKIITYPNCHSGFPMLWAQYQLDRRILRSVTAESQGSLSINLWTVSGFISYHQSITQLVLIIHQRYILVLQHVWGLMPMAVRASWSTGTSFCLWEGATSGQLCGDTLLAQSMSGPHSHH